jgi:hypothetical protein
LFYTLSQDTFQGLLWGGYKMPSLFLFSKKETVLLLERNMNMRTLQKLWVAIFLKIQVENYFNRNTVSVDSRRWKVHMPWCCNDCARRRDYKKENMSLSKQNFVKEFEKYNCYAKLHRLLEYWRMLRYQNLGRNRLILQTQCIFFPKLKKCERWFFGTSLIHEGVWA